MKKIFIIFLMLLLFPLCVNSQDQQYDFSYNTIILSNELFPEIKNYISILKKVSLTPDQAQHIIDDIYEIISKYTTHKKFIFVTPPEVLIYKLKTDQLDLFVLDIKLVLFDSDSSISQALVSGMIIRKKFILYIYEKNKNVEIEV